MTTDAPLPPTGIVVVDKPYRITSASVVRVVKGRLKAGGAPKRIKVGHAGTLDPLATGVLVVMTGRATRLADTVMQGVKGYRAAIDLARTSTTQDLEGELTDVPVEAPPTRAHIDQVLAEQFTGVIQQAPPAHSAIKINGTRAYKLARHNLDVAPEPRPVTIHDIAIVDYDFPTLTIDVTCGKGTYIRSLARDIGAALGAGGMLTDLRRTRVGDFTLDHALPLEDVPDPLHQDDLLITPAVRALIDAASAPDASSEPRDA